MQVERIHVFVWVVLSRKLALDNYRFQNVENLETNKWLLVMTSGKHVLERTTHRQVAVLSQNRFPLVLLNLPAQNGLQKKTSAGVVV